MDCKDHKDYKAVETLITKLENQLKELDTIPEQDLSTMKKDIEEHFSLCVMALDNRKNELLNQLTQKSQLQIQKLKSDINECLVIARDTLIAGGSVYNKHASVAEHFWKGTLSMTLPTWKYDELLVSWHVDLPNALLDAISSHGSIIKQVDSEARMLQINEEPDINFSINENQFDDEKFFDSSINIVTKNLPPAPNTESSPSPLSTETETISAPITTPTSREKFGEADMVTTFAGSAKGMQDGKGTEAQFDTITGICFNPNDERFYVGDFKNNAIRVITIEGNVSTFAEVKNVREIAYHEKERTFYATCVDHIAKITTQGQIADIIGSNKFGGAYGITIGKESGKIFVSDYRNHQIFLLNKERITHLAGSKNGFGDGEGRIAQFYRPSGICLDYDEISLLVCDNGNNMIRQVALNTAKVTTLCRVPIPRSIVVTSTKKILITNSVEVFQVSRGEYGEFTASSIAGGGKIGPFDGSARECRFRGARGIAVHEASNSCFITEEDGHRIRRMSFLWQ